jgi:predicted peptidase
LLTCGCNADPMRRVNAVAPANTGFVTRSVVVDGQPRNYSVFIPFSYSPDQHWPTIVFLHGIGEAGMDGRANLNIGLGPAIAEQPSAFPFIAIFPQSDGDWKGPDRERIVVACLDDCVNDLDIDPDRVILTGLSTGGYGTWHIGALHADRFAALVPLCGYKSLEDVPKLTRIPIWAFHNSGDPFMWSSASREMVERINKAGGRAKYTQYGAVGHDCWTRAYRDRELWDWMLEQRSVHP